MDAGQEQGGEPAVTQAKVALNVKPLTFEELGAMEGNLLKKMVQAEVAKIGLDISRRPDTKKARKLTIVLEFEPVDEDGLKVDLSMKTKTDLPPRETSAIRLANTDDGKLANLERPI